MAVTYADIPKIVERAAIIYKADADLIERYRGDYPASLMAVRQKVESDGRMDAKGDARLGEIGIYQITRRVEKLFGTPGERYTREGNTRLAAVRYNFDVELVRKRYPGFQDVHLFGTLLSAIGQGAAWRILDRLPATASFSDAVAWVRGRKLPRKVAYRVRAVWIMGEAARRLELRLASALPAGVSSE